MKAVNLLPPAERPRALAPVSRNASVTVLAVLAGLVLAVAGWVFTANQVNGRKSDIARAEQEKATAEQRSQGLRAFGDFSQIKETRVQSITDLADKRFDWERLMRELALVLPSKVWLSTVSAGGSASGEQATPPSGGSSGASPAGAGAGQAAAATAGSRTITLTGCARSQAAVAETIVRLRSLHGAEEVDLEDSARSDDEESSSATSSVGGSSTTGGSCGRYYQFTARISFKAVEAKGAGSKSRRTPARLGGGA